LLNVNSITGVILAGGLGTRLQPVISEYPKVMVPVLGRPYLTFLLDQLGAVGIHRIVLCTGFKADIVKKLIGDKYQNANILYSEESEPLGTGGAIRLAQKKISSDMFVVMNGDSYVNADLIRFFNWYNSAGHTAAIFLTKVGNIERYGHIITSSNGEIQQFIEKGSRSGPGWINAGVYLLNKKLFKSMPETVSFSLENDFFPSLIGNGLQGYKDDTEFIDIGTPKSFFQAEKFFLTLRLH
jgi:NDP-sugar pyrophosphorylase family protein